MHIEAFKRKLRQALGTSLQNASPASVREFVDQIQLELWREDHPHSSTGEPANRIEIAQAKPQSYEELMRSFFQRALVGDRDDSLVQLWILALDLAYSGIEEMHSEQMRSLFRSE